MPESIFPLIVFDFGMSGASITTIIYVGHFLLNIPKGPFKKTKAVSSLERPFTNSYDLLVQSRKVCEGF